MPGFNPLGLIDVCTTQEFRTSSAVALIQFPPSTNARTGVLDPETFTRRYWDIGSVLPLEALKESERGLDRITMSLSTLNVTPSWLLGFAVPVERIDTVAV